MKISEIISEGDSLNNPKDTFLTKSDTAYDFLRSGQNIANIKSVKTGKGNKDEPDVMIVPFGGKKEKDYLKKQLKRVGYKTQDADAKGADAHVDENTSGAMATSMGGGNGFVGGGPGTITRAPGSKKKKRSSKKT